MTAGGQGRGQGLEGMPIGTFRRRLLAWYDTHRRPLPWRGDVEPYAVMVSEAMLQQTRVDTVIPYFQRFLDRFPTVHDLAAASEEQVLKVWEGMGYYRRARHLHQAAREVVTRYGGRIPQDTDDLAGLPGLGAYAAAAVAAIAYDRPVAAVDGNVLRVLARVLDHPDPVDTTAGRRLLTAAAQMLLDRSRPGDFNQALMELGALVCRPRNPGCGECPVSRLCRSRAAGSVTRRPVRRGRQSPLLTVYRTAALVVSGVHILLARRHRDGLLGGLWELPAVAVPAAGSRWGRIGRLRAYLRRWGLVATRSGDDDPVAELHHRFSHLDWRVTVERLAVGCPGTAPPARTRPAGGIKGRRPFPPCGGEHDLLLWVHRRDLPVYPLPAVFTGLPGLDGR